MIKYILPVLLAAAGYTTGYAQTVQVYLNDTTWTTEPVTFSQADSTEGKVVANYVNHNNAEAYTANYYYSYKSGLVKTLYPSGKLMMKTVYQKGRKNGETTIYTEAGKLVIKGWYENDVKNGYWVYLNYGYMGAYKNGLKHGKWRIELPDGGRIVLHYKKGVLKEQPLSRPYIPKEIWEEGTVN